jgi:hypothetical protein
VREINKRKIQTASEYYIGCKEHKGSEYKERE